MAFLFSGPMRNRWSDREAGRLEGLDALVYATRTIGADPDLVLWGGGNSSAKVTMKDHLSQEVRVLWVKGSGSDMRTATAKHFTPLRQDELVPLIERGSMDDEEMVAYQTKCVLEPGAPKPSIETLLHAFIPAPHVYHTHADVICALTDTSDSRRLIRRVYGDEVALIPYVRPGFLLAKWVGEAVRNNPGLRAIILDKHGLVTWGNTARAAYLGTIRMVQDAERVIRRAEQRHRWNPVKPPRADPVTRRRLAAEALLALRGAIGPHERMLLLYEDRHEILQFLSHHLAKTLTQIGPFTPDHILHTKRIPLFLELPSTKEPDAIAQAVRSGVERYRRDYIRYVERYNKNPSLPMRDPNPRVILVPGVGLITTGKDRRATRIVRDLYVHTLKVIRAASALDTYTALSPKDLCEFEYWPMELYKLSLLPPEKEFSRHVVLVTGAAGAIGRAISERFVAEGAAVILTDLDEAKLHEQSAEYNRRAGEEQTFPLVMDVASERSVQEAFRAAITTVGGLDIVVSNAGIAHSAPVERLTLADWNRTLAVNATGHFLVCREAMRVSKRQGLGGNIVVVASKNVFAPGKAFGAYSASKAAQAQLARVLAIEGAEFGVRVNMVNPDGIFEGSGLWSSAMRAERAKVYDIPVDQIEAFYASRNLLKTRVTARDVADAVLFFASERSAKTTGAILPVDGGIKEAFPR
jgi:rhamnulose-1-phosphate aldolase/alcohol dehydrogenase